MAGIATLFPEFDVHSTYSTTLCWRSHPRSGINADEQNKKLVEALPSDCVRCLQNLPYNAGPILRSDFEHHGSQKSLYCVWADVHPGGDLLGTEILEQKIDCLPFSPG